MHVFSARKSFLGGVVLGLGCILFLSGCRAINLERPLTETNEFQDANLDGVWTISDKDSKPKKGDPQVVFAIENVENKYYSVSGMLPGPVSFTISRIPDDKDAAALFACIRTEDEPGDGKKVSYSLVRYTSSPDEIGIWTITKELQDGEDFKKLCQDPAWPNLVTADAEDVRAWCKNHAGEMELIFTLKRARFKTENARQTFLHISKFLPAHIRRVTAILAGPKDSEEKITDEQQKKMRAEFAAVRKWLSGSREMLSPELGVIFDQYISMQINGRKGRDVQHEIGIYTELIGKIMNLQLLE